MLNKDLSRPFSSESLGIQNTSPLNVFSPRWLSNLEENTSFKNISVNTVAGSKNFSRISPLSPTHTKRNQSSFPLQPHLHSSQHDFLFTKPTGLKRLFVCLIEQISTADSHLYSDWENSPFLREPKRSASATCPTQLEDPTGQGRLQVLNWLQQPHNLLLLELFP